MADITHISNGEGGLPVRNKLNEVIDRINNLNKTIIGDSYQYDFFLSNNGEFCITIRYKIAQGSSFVVNLFDVAPAHVYFVEYIDTMLDDVVAPGEWEIDRFEPVVTSGDIDTPRISILQGNDRGMLLGYHTTEYFGATSYVSDRRKMIDLISTPIIFTLTSTVSTPATIGYRKLVLKGYYIKD
jgi:hypothetical protein